MKGFTKAARRFTLTLAAAAAIGLTGCATPPSQPEIDEAQAEISVYENEHSFAWNIAHQMGISEYLEDAELGEGDLNALSRAGIYDTTTAVARTGSMLAFGNGFLGIGTQLLLGSGTREEILDNPLYLAYLPKDTAEKREKVFEKFLREIIPAAYEKAANEMGYRKRDNTLYMEFLRPAKGEEPESVIHISLGAHLNGEYLFGHDGEVPRWIPGEPGRVWVVGGIPGVKVTTREWHLQDRVEFIRENYPRKIELMERFAKHLPDRVYVFVPSMSDGKGGRTPAFVADNRNEYLFVVPKKTAR